MAAMTSSGGPLASIHLTSRPSSRAAPSFPCRSRTPFPSARDSRRVSETSMARDRYPHPVIGVPLAPRFLRCTGGRPGQGDGREERLQVSHGQRCKLVSVHPPASTEYTLPPSSKN